MAMKSAKRVRKTISISEEVQELLKELSRAYDKPQSYIIEELIKEKAMEYEKAKRLKAFEELIKSAKSYNGKIGNKTLQKIKEDMGDEL